MNGILNMIYIVFLMSVLVAFDYLYSTTDIVTSQIDSTITANFGVNAITTNAYKSYGDMRDMLYALVTQIMVPFLLFLSFFSSFVNRNQNVVMYLCQVIAILMITPLAIYVFSDLFSNLVAVSILNPAYYANLYFTYFPYIILANAFLALASFIFVQRTNTISA